MKKISIPIVFLFVLTLYFANLYADKKGLVPMTEIDLNLDYATEEEYYHDFNYKASLSGKLWFKGLSGLLGVFPKTIGFFQDMLNTFDNWLSAIWNFFTGIWDFISDVFSSPTWPGGSSGGGGGGGFRTR